VIEPRVRVLLVEDDEEDYILTRRLLQNNERVTFEVRWARSYEAALAELRRPCDACLVDYRLGPHSGLTLIERAIADGSRAPMILLTGRGDRDVDIEAMKVGAADYLVKDQITPQLMERVIRHSIERKGAERALSHSQDQLRQSQKMEAIGCLAAGVAHDFNNILSIILSYSQLLTVDLNAGDPMRADLEEINSAGLRAADLTRQLLAFSRRQVLQPRVVNLNDIISGMEKMLRRVIGEDVELTSLASPALRAIMADPGQMEQVIMNLVVNGRDAMPRGGKLTVETALVILDESHASNHGGAKPGPHVMLSVRDTGTGMDEATQARVFEPFFTTKGVGKGTGLGLATVFGIVQQSGGTICVYSEVGQGTTFKVYFPVAPAAVLVPPPSPVVERRTLRGSETILLVEDEERVRALALTILRKYGYNVLEAQGGGDAFLVSEQYPSTIHLLLTDVVMPLMSGRQLAERLTSLRPDMKVLYMSGYTDDAVVRHGVTDSTIAFIQKPITPEALARKVREVIGASSRVGASSRLAH
jgi:two-component system cell cycle sensor histidine kinase/response regulator CckA